MSETRFTPGPWRLQQQRGKGRSLGRLFVRATNDYGAIAHVCQRIDRDCNAHLIAAAPDLYAALEALLLMSDRGPQPRKFDEALSWRENDERAKAMAIAALAKARGEGC